MTFDIPKLQDRSGVLLSVVITCFFINWIPEVNSRSFKSALDLFHTLFFFFCSMLVLLSPHLKIFSKSQKVMAAFVTVVILGASVEFGQMFVTNRTASVEDILYNIAGAILAILIFSIIYSKKLRDQLISFIVFIGVCVMLLKPVSIALIDEFIARKQFPLLTGFETPFELDRWSGKMAKISRTKVISRKGDYSARLELTTEQYSGVQLSYLQEDWSDMNWLMLSVHSAKTTIVHIKVYDKLHEINANYANRFNGKRELHVGWNDLLISVEEIKKGPEGRELNLAQIRGMGLFSVNLEHPVVLYLDDVRLIN